MSKRTDPDLARWCAALATTHATDQVPPGWLRMEEVAALLGKSESHTFKLLAKAAREGRCEKVAYRIERGSRVLAVPHYRLK